MTTTPRPTPSKNNRRDLERFALSVPANVESPMQPLPNQTRSTSNISAGGVFFAADTTYPVGTKVTLNISLDFEGSQPKPHAPRFKIEGTVVRTEAHGMAVAFDPDRVISIRATKPKVLEQALSMIGILGTDPLLNDLLAARLSQELGQNCAQSADQDKIFSTVKPDLALIDCSTISVSEILTRLENDSSTLTNTSVALFNVADKRHIEVEAMNQGVRGVFFRNTSLKLLCKGVDAILKGELWFSRESMSQYLLGQQHHSSVQAQISKDTPELSPREQEILAMLAAGATNKDIAETLFLSLNTIKSHLYNIYKKIDVPNRLQASLWAAKHLPKNEHKP